MRWFKFFMVDVNAVWPLLNHHDKIHAVRILDRESGLVEVLTSDHDGALEQSSGMLRII